MDRNQIINSIGDEIERAIDAHFRNNDGINLEKIIHEGAVCLAVNHIILQEKLPPGYFKADLLEPIREGIMIKLHELFPDHFTESHHSMIDIVYSNILNSPVPKSYIENHYNQLFSDRNSQNFNDDEDLFF
ncbi:hypothetical protein SAMN04488104_10169 [Algoriphagus faecimaris]|uniref:Uncharacterized protein n=1 Tax=Algoriphagus faecimaris TaxID=686796 RepID=A0A1G6S9P4_9BACT|nr:hypothetical protein [Algoriphagus faecimaris]SDD13391.1 hypothetical protein SAMN04488104_10169 [Algoriphagus faecimaris]